jgi:hypothetical protein
MNSEGVRVRTQRMFSPESIEASRQRSLLAGFTAFRVLCLIDLHSSGLSLFATGVYIAIISLAFHAGWSDENQSAAPFVRLLNHSSPVNS